MAAAAQRRRKDELGIIFRNERGCGHPASAVDGGHGPHVEGGWEGESRQEMEGAEQAKMIDFFGDVGRRIEERTGESGQSE